MLRAVFTWPGVGQVRARSRGGAACGVTLMS
jgi:hypothetical protein